MSSKQETLQIFFSYAKEDADLCTKLVRHLRLLKGQRSIEIWCPQTAILPGNNPEQEIMSHLQHSQIILFPLSADYFADQDCLWQMQRALECQQRMPHRVSLVPILLRPCQWKECELRECLVLPRNQRAVTLHPNSDQALTEVVGEIRLLLEKIEQAPLLAANVGADISVLTLSPFPQKRENPYVGLRAFEFDEAPYFRGRERLVQEILDQINSALQIRGKGNRLIAVVGPSGSGKSSVVNAGVLPRLIQGALPSSESWIVLRTLRPGKTPLSDLIDILLDHLPPTTDRTGMRQLMSSENGLRYLTSDIVRNYQPKLARSIQTTGKVILVIDQFEEIFTQSEQEEAQWFLNNLMNAVTRPERDSPLLVILTFRADFYHKLMASVSYNRLYELMHEHEIAVFPMTLQEMRQAIEDPLLALAEPITFAPGLVSRLLAEATQQQHLLNSVQAQEDVLPLLQFTLASLFEHRQGLCISEQSYQEVGGLKGALKDHAERVYLTLSPEQQKIVPRLFLCLVTISLADRCTIARRRVLRSECEWSEDSTHQQLMHETMDTFINARLLTTDHAHRRPPTGQLVERAQETLEVSHEALLRAWPRLIDWIKDKEKELLLLERTDLDIYNWEQHQRCDERLYDGHHLKDLEDLHQHGLLNSRQTDFFQASMRKREREREQERKQKQKRQLITLSLLLLAVLASAGAYPVISFVLSLQAPKNLITSTLDKGPHSLHQVLQDAISGDTLTIDGNLAGKTITLESDLDFTKSVELRGNGILLSSPKGYKIHIFAGVNVIFDHVTIANSKAKLNGVVYNQGYLTLRDCDLSGNHSDYDGGALVNAQRSILLINHSIFHHNTASGSGGAIYNWDGTIVIANESQIFENQAWNNGGAIYSLRGDLSVSDSEVSRNTAGRNHYSRVFGGGMSIQNAHLSLFRSKLQDNTVRGEGGGLAVLGSSATIDHSIITNNTASQGGGISIKRNSENSYTAQITITGTEVTSDTSATYFIGKNKQTDPQADVADRDISGLRIKNETNRLIYTNKAVLTATGNPPPTGAPPENLINNFLGTIDIDAFCLTQGYGSGEPAPNHSSQIQCLPRPGTDSGNLTKSTPQSFSARDACKQQFKLNPSDNDIIDRLADYYDPSSWQCYRKVQPIEMVNNHEFSATDQQGLNRFCKNFQYLNGLDESNERKTAYDWNCQDASGQLVGLSVTDLCRFLTSYKDAFDRLADFNQVNGWECWRPITY